MTEDQVISIFRSALLVVLKIGGPALIVSIVVGLIISILQAATQVHEQTLTFVPKLLIIGAVLLLSAGWIINVISDFVNEIFYIMSTVT